MSWREAESLSSVSLFFNPVHSSKIDPSAFVTFSEITTVLVRLFAKQEESTVTYMKESILRAQPFDLQGSIGGCQQQWGATPRPMWATIAWGGKRIDTASNIVFTNGLLDPWCGVWVVLRLPAPLVGF